jgi:UDP-N-acetylmuramate: L-alanyl-gamma-D-glutamyl-meso-diaminopimelate ligase
MRLHILGICGTFMGGIARLARAAGHEVTGSDRNIYPPMSDQLADLGISISDLDDPAPLDAQPDLVVVGNAMSRGMPAVERVLDSGMPYTSGPAWLAERVLQGRWVVAVAGTHGKTTTASMLACILQAAGRDPGYLIGGVPLGSGDSAALGGGEVFVIEADEYDSAFFDKRSKFVHYRPRTLVLNNLEFDHADIFPDLAAIRTQFHHLIRTVPPSGRIIVNAADEELAQVLAMGSWTPRVGFSVDGCGMAVDDDGWDATLESDDGSVFRVCTGGRDLGTVHWGHIGQHNVANGLAAIAAAEHMGVAPEMALEALAEFPGVKRRMEQRGSPYGVTVYDDFAHHPTAIAKTLTALRARVGDQRILAVLEPRSNTMRSGHHRDRLAPSMALADRRFLFQPEGLGWSLQESFADDPTAVIEISVTALADAIVSEARPGDQVLVMSNGGFGGLHDLLIARLEARAAEVE